MDKELLSIFDTYSSNKFLFDSITHGITLHSYIDKPIIILICRITHVIQRINVIDNRA